MEINFRPIGIIHSPFTSLDDMPIQPTSDASGSGYLEIFPEYAAGIKDLEGFSHIYLLYYFHEVGKPKLSVTPYLDKQPHGIFATRAPSRPNPIGLSLVKLVRVEENLIYLDRLDVLDGTPLLDIKPYIPAFEDSDAIRIGWLEKAGPQMRTTRSDSRFK